MAPYSSFEFVNDFIFTGNPDLKRTLVNNYDLRWEWFMRPGEILAVSGFYKDFKNPIERVILNTNGEIKYQNVSEAQVWGLELEMSKKLGQIHSALQHLNVGANLTLTHSQTSIAPSELEIIRAFDPDADATRPMQGESPYVINVDLSYTNPNTGTELGAYYHVFGERPISVSLGGTPDLYEQPRHQVDVNFSQQLWSGFSLSASVSNLLGEPYRAVHRYKDVDYVGEGYPRGRSFSVGLSYDI
jgi:outer membrane receptor protein involved in Fe transport